MGKLIPVIDDILTSLHSTSIAIAGNVTVYTKSFEFGAAEYWALDYKATSDGTPGLKIELEQGNSLPTTEGSSDTGWVVAESASDIEAALADENQHYKKLSPVVTKYGRLKITGSSNHASTTLRAKLARQEEV